MTGASPQGSEGLGNPRRVLVVLCGFLGLSAGYSSTYLYTSGLFILPIAEQFGLSRGEASLGPLFCTLTAAAVTPLLGMVLDRFGALVVALGSLIGLAIGFFLLARFTSDVQSYVGLSVLLAMLGAGSTGLSFSRLVLSACDRRRGMALGIVMTGSGFGALVLPPAIMPVIQENGWRSAYETLGLLPLGAALLLAIILLPMRRHLGPASSAPARGFDGDRDPAPFSLWRSRPFWMISGLFFLLAVASVGLVVHFVPMLIGAGLTPVQAANIAGLIGLAAIAGRLVIGYCLDRFPVDRLATIIVIVALLSASLMFADAGAFGIAAALALGFVMGAESDLLPFYALRYFPDNRYGSVFGGICGLFLVGGAIGPAAVGYAHDLTRDYSGPLLLIIATFLVALLPAFLLRAIVPAEGARSAEAHS